MNVGPDMTVFLLTSLCPNLAFAVSFRTSIPERKRLVQSQTSQVKHRTLVRPELDGFPSAIPKE